MQGFSHCGLGGPAPACIAAPHRKPCFSLQVLLALGLVGGTVLAVQHPDVPLPQFVAQTPSAVWFVGPAFASLSGICIKEG